MFKIHHKNSIHVLFYNFEAIKCICYTLNLLSFNIIMIFSLQCTIIKVNVAVYFIIHCSELIWLWFLECPTRKLYKQFCVAYLFKLIVITITNQNLLHLRVSSNNCEHKQERQIESINALVEKISCFFILFSQ